jgi:hypothetical protein
MSSHRATVVAFAAAFMLAMTSLASACCAPVAPGRTNSPNPVPLAPAPIYVGPWSGGWSLTPWSFVGGSVAGWGSCGCCGCGAAPSPLYVVDQGPDYTGPGVMVPFLTYTPTTHFPYVSGCCESGAAPSRQPVLVRKASYGQDKNAGGLSLRQAQYLLEHADGISAGSGR